MRFLTKLHVALRTLDDSDVEDALLPVLTKTHWDMDKTAEQFGVVPRTLYRVVKKSRRLSVARERAQAAGQAPIVGQHR